MTISENNDTIDDILRSVESICKEFPEKYFNEILQYMNIDEDVFWNIIDKNRSPHLWKKNNSNWELLHQVQNI